MKTRGEVLTAIKKIYSDIDAFNQGRKPAIPPMPTSASSSSSSSETISSQTKEELFVKKQLLLLQKGDEENLPAKFEQFVKGLNTTCESIKKAGGHSIFSFYPRPPESP